MTHVRPSPDSRVQHNGRSSNRLRSPCPNTISLADASHVRDHCELTLDELGEYAAGRNPKGYTEADVPRLTREVSAERPCRRKVRSNG
jgi:hypothetical protein